MIPSSARRTLIFLLLSVFVFFWPDWVIPSSWAHDATYLLVSNLYQGLLVISGFWFGPALCKAMVIDEVSAGPLHQAVDQILNELNTQATAHSLTVLPVTLVDHPQPFIVTAGMLPCQSQVFVSTAQAVRLGPAGLRFLLARAMIHGDVPQRMASIIPLLLLTAGFPNTLNWVTSLYLAGYCLGWLALHWYVELRVDAKAARVTGPQAIEGLREVMATSATLAGKLSLPPPKAWRLKACQGSLT